MFLLKQTENSQLNVKISGMERKSNGKRDSFLAQTKNKKKIRNQQPKYVFKSIFNQNFKDKVYSNLHTTLKIGWKNCKGLNKGWDCRGIESI